MVKYKNWLPQGISIYINKQMAEREKDLDIWPATPSLWNRIYLVCRASGKGTRLAVKINRRLPRTQRVKFDSCWSCRERDAPWPFLISEKMFLLRSRLPSQCRWFWWRIQMTCRPHINHRAWFYLRNFVHYGFILFCLFFSSSMKCETYNNDFLIFHISTYVKQGMTLPFSKPFAMASSNAFII